MKMLQGPMTRVPRFRTRRQFLGKRGHSLLHLLTGDINSKDEKTTGPEDRKVYFNFAIL